MTQTIAISKDGINVLTATDPNDFIFHSLYNTFKIVASLTTTVSVLPGERGTAAVSHGLSYTPVCTAFANKSGSGNVYGFGTFIPGGFVDAYSLDDLYSDSSVVSAVVQNEGFGTVSSDYTVRFFLFEASL